jgi:hypothetical protein
MKKISALIAIATCLLCLNKSIAQQLTTQQEQAISKLFKTNSVVYFNFKVHSMQEIAGFSKMFSVDRVKGAEVFAHANKPQFTQFVKINYPYKVTSGGTAKKKVVTKTKTTTTKKAVQKK